MEGSSNKLVIVSTLRIMDESFANDEDVFFMSSYHSTPLEIDSPPADEWVDKHPDSASTRVTIDEAKEQDRRYQD